jgi:hypothetical protein
MYIRQIKQKLSVNKVADNFAYHTKDPAMDFRLIFISFLLKISLMTTRNKVEYENPIRILFITGEMSLGT